MKAVGEEFLTRLKRPDILDRKPYLKIKQNHLKDAPRNVRIWSGGTLVRDGNGGYRRKN